MIDRYDQWKTASPYDDFDDELCIVCGMELNLENIVTGEEPEDEGFCCEECREGFNNRVPGKRYVLPCIRPMWNFLNTELGREGAEGWSKSLYKGTACGAWLALLDHQTIQVGSIVEGSEYEVDPNDLVWPFTREQFWDTVQDIEDQCQEIWMDTHGCEKCAELTGEDGPVHPDCPECEGLGIVI